MLKHIWKLPLLLMATTVALAQNAPPREKCEFDPDRASDGLQRIAGIVPTAYYFACQEDNPNADATGCIKDAAKPGPVVSVNREVDGWACVSGIDSTSGWLQASALEPLPAEPHVSLMEWKGWWEHPAAQRVKGGLRNDRLLVTAGKEPGSLSVSGRAYWYGVGTVVHYGQLNAEAKPVGKHLHVVDGSCVVDLALASTSPAKLLAHQNEFEALSCGGMNVSFDGDWVKFTPESRKPQKR